MKLYIVGNGFDLAHGLPTAYWNFREYLEKVDCGFLSAFEKHLRDQNHELKKH